MKWHENDCDVGITMIMKNSLDIKNYNVQDSTLDSDTENDYENDHNNNNDHDEDIGNDREK